MKRHLLSLLLSLSALGSLLSTPSSAATARFDGITATGTVNLTAATVIFADNAIPLAKLTGLTAALAGKADLVGGKIPVSQIPTDDVQIELRSGTTAELAAADPALLANEPAFNTTTQRFQVGPIPYARLDEASKVEITYVNVTESQTTLNLSAGKIYDIHMVDGGDLNLVLEQIEGAVIEVYISESYGDIGSSALGISPAGIQEGRHYVFWFSGGAWQYSTSPITDLNALATGRTGGTSAHTARASLGVGNNYATPSFSSAGNATVAHNIAARITQQRFTVGAGTAAYTHTVSVVVPTNASVEGKIGDRVMLDFLMPASANPTVEVRNATSTGTLLATVPADAATARTWRVELQNGPTAWQLVGLHPLNSKEYLESFLRQGTGSPEGVVTARAGTLYTRTDGGAGTTLYVKESGTGNTGWTAK